MNDWKKLLNVPTIRYIDQRHENRYNPAASFATDDALAIAVGNGDSPVAARLWIHDDTLILGIPDAKLPNLKNGVDWLKSQGYQAVVRNSGGLAVALDKGVLNLSFIFPDARNIGIHEGYQAMAGFIQFLFQDLTRDIKAFEVKGSYCPGEYDLSIGGKKFAGISQRRVKNGSAVQIYLCVEGDGVERAALVRDFYSISKKGEETRFEYPDVIPETMASLCQLLKVDLTVEDVTKRILHALKELSDDIITDKLDKQETDWYEKRLEQMIDRNEKALKF
ncbi:lipoate--protein ligase family protein [Sediminibacillus massiliensis]|uniref:lipoate--protein ligase family protein n=1 Tax=Sediminibacillus massiliensis TaxID=1926277 RepID=UPI00098883DF|nr:lipoate--protein ligase family protein [Sediminibacillus massiliensis]